MSAGLYYIGNLVQQDQTSIVASNEDAFYPAENLKHFHTTKTYRTQVGTLSSIVVFDFKTTETINTVMAVADATGGFGYNSVTIEANATNEWSSPAFISTLTLNHEFGLGHVEFANQNYRFWRLTFSGAGEYLEVSKIYIGKKTDMGTNTLSYNWTIQDKDLSTEKVGRYGQKFIDRIIKNKVISGSYKALNKTELDILFDVFDEVGTHTPFFFLTDLDCGLVNDFERIGGYFYFNDMPKITNVNFGLFETSINLEEAI